MRSQAKILARQGINYVIKARCAFRRRAASCARDVKVVLGLYRGLASIEAVSEISSSRTEFAEFAEFAEFVAVDRPVAVVKCSPGGHVAFSAAGFAGWK